jgi:formylglycine-generating enzyme required for sulfatase activity
VYPKSPRETAAKSALIFLLLAGCTAREELPQTPTPQPETQANRQPIHSPPEFPAAKQPESLQLGSRPSAGENFTLAELPLDMVWVRRGSFTMGSVDPKSPQNEKPESLITLSKGFWIARTETRQDLFERLMNENPSQYKGPDQPVENVAFFDAREFCRKLTNIEKEHQRLPDGYKYQLPTEAQWEFAAKGKILNKDEKAPSLTDAAWHRNNSNNTTHPVAEKASNILGLHDMRGNVFELCNGFVAPYPGRHVVDWTGKSLNRMRVARGGSWFSNPEKCTQTFRLELPPNYPMANVGFRVALVFVKESGNP